MQRVIVDGIGLEVQRIEGARGGQAAPLVFLHEGLGSVAMWRDWPTRVCEVTGRDGIVYSRRGYGQSDPIPDIRGAGRLPADYMHREAWEVLPGLLAALGIDRPPVLVGHSDGGTIALLYASRHPLSACVVMAPHVNVEDVSIRSIEQARDAYDKGLRERLARFHENVDVAFWQWNDAWLSPAFGAFDIRADCRRIAAPVLAIQGTDDAYGTLRQIEEIAPTAGPFEMEVLPQCGHSPHRDQPEAVTSRIASFLADKP